MQRSADPGELSRDGYISIAAPAFMASEMWRKRGWKDCESHNTKMTAVELALLGMAA